MNTEDLTKWHDEEFRPKYKHMLETPIKTKWGPGGKGKSLAKILRMKPSKELRDKIIFEIEAQMRHRKVLCDKLGLEKYLKHTGDLAKTGNGDIYKNRLIPTWLNDMGWMDEIPEIEIIEKKVNIRLCACGEETMPAHHQCESCYAKGGLRIVK